MAQYVPYYALIAAPLHKLTRKGEVFPTGSKWIPGSDYDLAYHHVKSLMLDSPLYIWNKDNERHSFLEVDACDDGWGACSYQHADKAPPNEEAQAHNSVGFQGVDHLREEESTCILQGDDRSHPRVRTLPQPHRDTGTRSWGNVLLRPSAGNQGHLLE